MANNNNNKNNPNGGIKGSANSNNNNRSISQVVAQAFAAQDPIQRAINPTILRQGQVQGSQTVANNPAPTRQASTPAKKQPLAPPAPPLVLSDPATTPGPWAPQQPGPTDPPASTVPQFDWEAWNAEMATRQQAMWDSMDAMNAAFIQKQQEWYANNSRPAESRNTTVGSSAQADRAAVKINKKTKKPQSTAIGNNGVSLGGQGNNNNGLSIVNTPKGNLGG